MLIFRKKLLLDTDAQELARVKLILDKHGIKYEVKTTVSENVISRRFNANAAVYTKGAYSDMAAQSYVYQLFVSPSKYAEARKLCYGK